MKLHNCLLPSISIGVLKQRDWHHLYNPLPFPSHFPFPSGCSLRTEPVPSTLPVSSALAMSQQRQPFPWGFLPAMAQRIQALACVFGWQGRLGLLLLWQVWCIFLDLIRDGSSIRLCLESVSCPTWASLPC